MARRYLQWVTPISKKSSLIKSYQYNMVIFFTFDLMKAARGQKKTSEAKKKHEEVDLLKKVFNKSLSMTSKTPSRVQSDLSRDGWSYYL